MVFLAAELAALLNAGMLPSNIINSSSLAQESGDMCFKFSTYPAVSDIAGYTISEDSTVTGIGLIKNGNSFALNYGNLGLRGDYVYLKTNGVLSGSTFITSNGYNYGLFPSASGFYYSGGGVKATVITRSGTGITASSNVIPAGLLTYSP